MVALTFTEEFTSTVKAGRIDAGGQIKQLKHRIDVIDKENLTYKYGVIEGDGKLEKLESIIHELKFEAITEQGGCKVKNVSKYYPKQGVEMKEEDFKVAREEAFAILKVVDAYLVANPQAYA